MSSAIFLLVLTVEIFTCSCISAHEQTQGEEPNLLQDEIFKELSSYELVTPHIHRDVRWRRDTNTKTKVGHHSDTVVLKIYSRASGRNYILELKLNRGLLPFNSVASHYDTDGRLVTTPFQEADHCFYQGSIKGSSNSTAAISTCKGIEGYIYDGSESFYIQPVQSNETQGSQIRHIFYNMKDLKKKEHTCGQGHSLDSLDPRQVFHNPIHLHRRARRDVQKETKYVEMVIVNDRKQYIKYNRNIKDTEYRAKQVANFVDSLYRPLHIRIAAVLIITWSNADQIVVDADTDKLLENFYNYAKGGLRQVLKQASIASYDNAMLLSDQDFAGTTVGKAYLNVMCSDQSTGIIQDHSRNAASTAATLAHEMGHNFGLSHDDDIAGCACNDKDGLNCIMHSVSSGFKPMSTWSTCSISTLNANLAKGLDSCLFNKPSKIYGDPICGNGFTEPGEQCDCGTVEECKKYGEGCCNATTCQLNPGAECDEGVCCKSCKFVSRGTQCREKLNDCDIPESCTGKAAECPENVYIQNGRSCENGKGYCYNGICPMHDKQCKTFWGKDAVSGPQFCYKPNTNGDVYGNCNEFADGTFQTCKLEDIKCGSLHCTSGTPGVDLPRNPVVPGGGWQSYTRTFTSGGQRTICKKVSVSTSGDAPNPGKTTEGTKCGENRLCKDSKCIHLDELSWQLPLCPRNCSSHGVCTNKGYCVCDPFWTGTDCATATSCIPGSPCTTTPRPTQGTKLPPTTEGSTEKGRIPAINGQQGESVDSQTILIAVLVPTFIILLIVVVVLAFMFRKRHHLKQNWRSRSANNDSTKKNRHFSLTRNAEPPAQDTPYFSKLSERPSTPTSPTNLAFEFTDEGSPPASTFSGMPPRLPVMAKPVPSRPPAISMVPQRPAPIHKPVQTQEDANVKSFEHSQPRRPVFPPSVPKLKPVNPDENQSVTGAKPIQPKSHQLPLQPPPHPFLKQKPVSQAQNQLPANPTPHPFLKLKPVSQEQNQQDSSVKPVQPKSHQVPVNPPPHPFLKKKPVGGSDQSQPESGAKSGEFKPQLPAQPPRHPLLKKPIIPGQNQQNLDTNSVEAKKPEKPVYPPPALKNKPTNQVTPEQAPKWKMQEQRNMSSNEDKPGNDSPILSTSNHQRKPLVPPPKPHSKPSTGINDNKHKISSTPLPRNRTQTPPESDVGVGHAPYTKPLLTNFGQPLKPTLPVPDVNSVIGKPLKPPVNKDTEESNESAKKPLKYPTAVPRKSSLVNTLEDSVDSKKPVAKISPLQQPRMPKPPVDQKPSPAPKPTATSSAPTPAKKPAGAKVALPLPPGAKLR